MAVRGQVCECITGEVIDMFAKNLSVALSGHFLTDNAALLQKWRITYLGDSMELEMSSTEVKTWKPQTGITKDQK